MNGPLFSYERGRTESHVLSAMESPGTALVAGGTDLLPLWRVGVCRPERVIDIQDLALRGVTVEDEGIRIGALTSMAEVADSQAVQEEFPLVSAALLASASPQVRNRATIGGNLLQKTRCGYFRAAGTRCNKREPGTGCAAREGEHRLHAIFGTSEACIAVHASDLAVALVAVGARVYLRSLQGERSVLLEEFYDVPGSQPNPDTVLRQGELITEIKLPRRCKAPHSLYIKVSDRASFEFAVVSLAAIVEVVDGHFVRAELVAGGVGTKPWRLEASERVLRNARATEASIRDAIARAGSGARPLERNAFKVELLERLVRRALIQLCDAHV